MRSCELAPARTQRTTRLGIGASLMGSPVAIVATLTRQAVAAPASPPAAPAQAADAAPARVLTLGQAVKIASRAQPQVRAAQAATEAAEGRADQARSGLYP